MIALAYVLSPYAWLLMLWRELNLRLRRIG